MSNQSLSHERIVAALSAVVAGRFGEHILYLPQTTSTNEVARQLANEGAPEGTVVVADWQSAGRGRMGRDWQAPPEAALLTSILFRPVLSPMLVGRLIMVCGMAVVDAVDEATGMNVTVKWPNDLRLSGKKFAGILVDSAIVEDKLAWSVAGLGINVNFAFLVDDPLAQVATTLSAATGQFFDRARLLADILARLRHWYELVSSPALLASWRAHCETLGQHTQVRTSDGLVEGLAEDIDESGALWVRLDSGEQQLATVSS